MADKIIKKITDRSLFNSVFNKLFLGRDVLLKTDQETIPVHFESYDGGMAVLRIPDNHDVTDGCIVFIERQKDIVFSHLNLKSDMKNSRYMFDVVDIQILEKIKKEESPANEVRSSPRSGHAYISNIISDFSLIDCLKGSTRRVEYLRSEILKKLNNLYPFSKVFFIHDKRPDYRMEFFQNNRRPYFFPELVKSAAQTGNSDLMHFMTNIQPKDFYLTDNKLTSEICVPILYKLMLPFGYIQINSTGALGDSDYSAIRKLGMTASVLFSNDTSIIKSADDIISISDISETGMGIIFKDKPLIKHFKDDSTILFNVVFSDTRKASILAKVRHITLIENKIYRVGVEVMNIDPIGEVYYSEYVESTGKNSGKQS